MEKERALVALLEKESHRAFFNEDSAGKVRSLDCWGTEAVPLAARAPKKLPVLKERSLNDLAEPTSSQSSALPAIEESGPPSCQVREVQPRPFRIKSLVTDERPLKKVHRVQCSFRPSQHWNTATVGRNRHFFSSFDSTACRIFAPGRVLRSSIGHRRRVFN